jgi:hypothetical protein
VKVKVKVKVNQAAATADAVQQAVCPLPDAGLAESI